MPGIQIIFTFYLVVRYLKDMIQCFPDTLVNKNSEYYRHIFGMQSMLKIHVPCALTGIQTILVMPNTLLPLILKVNLLYLITLSLDFHNFFIPSCRVIYDIMLEY